jgi:hypothetical protein
MRRKWLLLPQRNNTSVGPRLTLHGDTLRKSPEKTAKRHKLDIDATA